MEKKKTICSAEKESFSKGPDAREREIREVRPITELAGITTKTNPLRVGWGRSVKDKQLMPTRRRDVGIGWRSDRASVPIAGECGEDGT